MKIEMNTIYHLQTREIADDFLIQAENQKLKWATGLKATEVSSWGNTDYCIRTNENHLAGRDTKRYYENNGSSCQIIEWEIGEIHKTESIEHIKFENAPESWGDRCSGDGYTRIINKNGDRVFADNGVSVGIGYRPCAKCGEYPNKRGDDHCIANLGNVINACCGHGKNKGYIQFDNGITIRGYFEIEYDKKGNEIGKPEE